MSAVETVADLTEEIKSRSAPGAAAKLAGRSGSEIVAGLLSLNAGFAQDVLAALAAAPKAVAGQWQRNALYEPHAIGRMMEPVIAAYPPEQTIGETIERLHELVKSVLVTYIYVVAPDGTLLGVVTMRDLLFNPPLRRLEEVMLRDVFALHATAHLEQTMRQVLDRHYPVYPAVDAEGRLIGLVRGQTMFEAQAIELTAGGLDGRRGQGGARRHAALAVVPAAPPVAAGEPLHRLRHRHGGEDFRRDDRGAGRAGGLPVLSCLAGNNGCHALAVTLCGITLGDLDRHRLRDIVTKEAKLGALNGLFTGLVAGAAMYFFARDGAGSPLVLAGIMLVAMVFGCVLSCLLGTLVPMLVRRLGADPATASSLFVLSVTDTLGMAFMLVLATSIAL